VIWLAPAARVRRCWRKGWPCMLGTSTAVARQRRLTEIAARVGAGATIQEAAVADCAALLASACAILALTRLAMANEAALVLFYHRPGGASPLPCFKTFQPEARGSSARWPLPGSAMGRHVLLENA